MHDGGGEGNEGGKDGPYDLREGGAYVEGDNVEGPYDDDNGDGDEEWRNDGGDDDDDEAMDGGYGVDAFRDKASGAGYSNGDFPPPAVTFHDEGVSQAMVKLLRKLLPTADSQITLSKLGFKIPFNARPYVNVSEMRYDKTVLCLDLISGYSFT